MPDPRKELLETIITVLGGIAGLWAILGIILFLFGN